VSLRCLTHLGNDSKAARVMERLRIMKVRIILKRTIAEVGEDIKDGSGIGW
jgi:hypothetical protein